MKTMNVSDGISLSTQKMTLLPHRKSMKYSSRRTTREVTKILRELRKLRSGDRIRLVTTQPWWAHISCGVFGFRSRRYLAGTQIFGFLATEALAQKARWPAITNDWIDLLNANYSLLLMKTTEQKRNVFAREGRKSSPAALNPGHSGRFYV